MHSEIALTVVEGKHWQVAKVWAERTGSMIDHKNKENLSHAYILASISWITTMG